MTTHSKTKKKPKTVNIMEAEEIDTSVLLTAIVDQIAGVNAPT